MINFEKIDRSFLEVSRKWFSNADFRRLIMAEQIEKDAQEAWFASLSQRTDYYILGVKSFEGWVGACGLKHIDPSLHTAEYWGYIYPTELRGRGVGRQMFDFVASKAVDREIQTIWLRVSVENKIAVKCYERWGFSAVCKDESEVIRMEMAIERPGT
ncbi:GNAT family N-acetyltransferase [Tabrizicola sp.]|uniref:GNAT family N-acetyltransferase n=1 Tax=Tabrizicola sp. TaxID=2005166 RepID=UPI002736EF4B|nr:GNAT family N-acetyltransferase [Tabrizicola sp.]MDP3197161.1 GNAT family N-acetyltransferase [Tabrizicola sp.]MDZ4067892.1 GNAT family N-acetyltransferase [Tabrizicola sp.]